MRNLKRIEGGTLPERGNIRPDHLWAVLAVTLFIIITLLAPAAISLAATTRVSVDSTGVEGNQQTYSPFISGNGRYVAFHSDASNLVPGDTNGYRDVFVHDRLSGETTRVSVHSNGTEADSYSYDPALSADGRYVAFESRANNLVDGDTNATWDVFVHDRETGTTTRVSLSSSDEEGDDESEDASISSDGEMVAFSSRATNLVANDNNGFWDIFVRNRSSRVIARVSVDSSGNEADAQSDNPRVSGNGRYVVFESEATNLVTDDTNGRVDIFVHDIQTSVTTRVSVDSSGNQATGDSGDPSISDDGRYVAFVSSASNLISGDTNGYDDVFVHDRQTGQTTLVSVDSSGGQGNLSSTDPHISGNGRFVAFASLADNLVDDDTNGTWDVFVHDRATGQTTRVSVGSEGAQGNAGSASPAISASGVHVSFISDADNLVIGDTNSYADAFVYSSHAIANPYLLLLGE